MRSSPNRLVAVTVGALYLVAGIAGLFVTAGIGVFTVPGRVLLGVFAINPSAAVLDVLAGAALLIAGLSTVAASKVVTTILGATFLVLGIAGLFVIGTPFNVLALNGADNVLHFASSVALLAVALGADRSVTTVVTS